MGYEIDPHYGAPATELWRETGLDIRVEDFTLADPPAESEKFNLLICNPPYVRHHHIDGPEKLRLKIRTRNSCKLEINGLAGLYCYFLGLCHTWMADGALAGWLIPSEFMDVNYGAAVKSYLLDEVTLLHVHRFDPNDVQFNDALVSSAVVWFRKEKPSPNRSVRFNLWRVATTTEAQPLCCRPKLCATRPNGRYFQSRRAKNVTYFPRSKQISSRSNEA